MAATIIFNTSVYKYITTYSYSGAYIPQEQVYNIIFKPCTISYHMIIIIIESVDSISRDDPDVTYM